MIFIKIQILMLLPTFLDQKTRMPTHKTNSTLNKIANTLKTFWAFYTEGGCRGNCQQGRLPCNCERGQKTKPTPPPHL